jgi:hypothetical protein
MEADERILRKIYLQTKKNEYNDKMIEEKKDNAAKAAHEKTQRHH